jgi:hypothetical protein
MTLVRGEAAPRRGKERDDVSWTNANLTGPKNKETPRVRFSWYKWMVKIQSTDELIYFFKTYAIEI